MSGAAFVVTDLLVARAGREAELEAALREVAAEEAAAALRHGAERFALYAGEAPGHFLLLEHWTDRDAFDAFHARHRPAALTAFLARADELLARPLAESVHRWTRRLV